MSEYQCQAEQCICMVGAEAVCLETVKICLSRIACRLNLFVLQQDLLERREEVKPGEFEAV